MRKSFGSKNAEFFGLKIRGVYSTCFCVFNRSMVAYSTTHSKDNVKLTGCWEPSGGYTTIHDVLDEEVPRPECPPGDCRVTFDNNQKVGRSSGRLKEGGSVPLSVCTSLSYITPVPHTELQTKAELKPSVWSTGISEEVLSKVSEEEEKFVRMFSLYKHEFIGETINQ